ncbi:MAG: MerR family transcriptional regulator [Desulfovibrionaceae bacterium]|nr:MerR family transcriptional regulator [Desulfovibrionaceae bacterium]
MERMEGDAGLLTIAEIAKNYGLPESTARFYCKRFIDYLPHVGEGKRRRYRAEVLEIFAVILGEMKKRKNAGAVEALLAARFPKNIELQAAQPQALQGNSNTAMQPAVAQAAMVDLSQVSALVHSQGEALGQIAVALTRLADGQQDVRELRDRLAERDEELATLRKEVDTLKHLQRDAEAMYHDDVESLRKWLSQLAQHQAAAAK